MSWVLLILLLIVLIPVGAGFMRGFNRSTADAPGLAQLGLMAIAVSLFVLYLFLR
jgi:hypothetical protein